MDWLFHGNLDHRDIRSSPVVFLPGWGFGGRILQMANPPPSWWSPAEPLCPEGAGKEVDALLEARQWGKIILVGWSMGARLAMEYAVRRPAAIDALVLLSLRRHWPEEELAAIRSALAADPAGFMSDFYRKCFLGDRQAWRQFAASELEGCLREIHTVRLKAGLDCLAKPLGPLVDQLEKIGLPPERLWLLHGEKDIIAPFEDRCLLRGGRHMALKNRGHALFLAPEVRTLSILPKRNLSG